MLTKQQRVKEHVAKLWWKKFIKEGQAPKTPVSLVCGNGTQAQVPDVPEIAGVGCDTRIGPGA